MSDVSLHADHDGRLPRTCAVELSPVMPHRLTDLQPLCTIDARNRIASANARWARFIAPRADVGAVLDRVLGRSICKLMPEGEVRHLCMLLYRRVRAAGAPAFVPMHLDLPDQRRLLDVELRPLADGSILHVFELVWNQTRAVPALLDPGYPRDERTLRHCWWCGRVQVGTGTWEEIETAQNELAMDGAETLPRLSSASCGPCRQAVLGTFPLHMSSAAG